MIVEDSGLDTAISVELVLGDNSEIEDDPVFEIAMTCDMGIDGELLWSVAVSPDAHRQAFGVWRAAFKPSGETSLKSEIPHQEGLAWFDDLVNTFLAYVSPLD